MSNDIIRYGILAQEALRGVVRTVLRRVEKRGLPGDHHFYITFDTHAPGVVISKRLHDRYPEEMTIVIQHQFWGLKVSEQAFEIGLSFNNVPETLVIPFSAIKTFMDPSAEFMLQFGTFEVPGKPAQDEGGKVAPAQAVDEPAEGLIRGGLPSPATRAETVLPPPPDHAPAQKTPKPRGKTATPQKSAEVVHIDKFRKQ